MSLANNLRLLRDSCRDLQSRGGEAAGVLAPSVALLNDVLVQLEALPAIGAAAAARYAALPGQGDGGQAAVSAKLAEAGALDRPAGRAFARAAVAIDREYWDGYGEAVLREGAVAPAGEVGDEIDTGRLAVFLNGVAGEGGLTVTGSRTVSRGFSKKTVLVELAGNQVLPREIALRIDQPFNYLGTKVADEYPWLQQLWEGGARIPRPFALEPSGDVLGQAFIVSAKVDGGAVGGNYVAPPADAGLAADIASVLAGIHTVKLDGLPRGGAPHIEGEIEAHYRDWQATGALSATVEAGFAWVRANVEAAYGTPAIIHNDFNFNNMMIEAGRVVAVVDWEFAHIGTPAADLGYFYYSAEGIGCFEAFLQSYEAAGGIVPARAQLDFYIFWGQLRLVVMGFQAVKGLNDGSFKDIRFAATLGHLRSGMRRIGALLPGLLG